MGARNRVGIEFSYRQGTYSQGPFKVGLQIRPQVAIQLHNNLVIFQNKDLKWDLNSVSERLKVGSVLLRAAMSDWGLLGGSITGAPLSCWLPVITKTDSDMNLCHKYTFKFDNHWLLTGKHRKRRVERGFHWFWLWLFPILETESACYCKSSEAFHHELLSRWRGRKCSSITALLDSE